MYRITNAEERAKKSPGFQIPPREIRETLSDGMDVKLIFSDQERIWVRILAVKEDRRYVGVIINQPVTLEELNSGDTVEFGPEHIIDIEM